MNKRKLFRNFASILGSSDARVFHNRGGYKSKWVAFTPILLVLFGLLLLTGCAGQVAPGDTVEFKRSLDFYLSNGAGGYRIIKEADYPRLLAGAKWVVDDGLSLVADDISLSPAEVTWTAGNTQYTAQGAKLTVEVEVLVAEDAQPGWRGINLKLPGLPSRGAATGVSAVFPDYKLGIDINEGISIAGVTVHETAGSRNLEVIKRIGLITVVGVVIVGVIILALSRDWSTIKI
jgi:hypothetical protein